MDEIAAAVVCAQAHVVCVKGMCVPMVRIEAIWSEPRYVDATKREDSPHPTLRTACQ